MKIIIEVEIYPVSEVPDVWKNGHKYLGQFNGRWSSVHWGTGNGRYVAHWMIEGRWNPIDPTYIMCIPEGVL